MGPQKTSTLLAWGVSVGMLACSDAAPKPGYPIGSIKSGSNSDANSGSKETPRDSELNPPAGKTLEPAGPTDAFALTQQLDEARKVALELKDRKKATHNQLALVQQVNNKFCQRLFQYRNECGPAARLLPDPTEKVFGCVSNVDNPLHLTPQFTVKVAGSAAQFKLVADQNIESSPFFGGQTTVLTWNADASKDKQSPRISDLINLKLKQLSGTLTPLADLDFEFKMGSAVVFNKADLFAIPDSLSSYRLNVLALSEDQRSPACRVPDSELALLIELARKDIEAQPALEDTAAASSPVPAGTLDESALATDAEKLALLKKNIDTLRAGIGLQASSLDRENDRNGKLRRELMGDASTGCFAKQSLNKLEIILKGEHLVLPDWDRLLAKNAVAPVGSPKQITFQFGDDLSYVHADEEQQSVFRADGSLVITTFTNRKIGDIERISLKKGGVSYDSLKNCWNTFPLGQACEWQNRESARYKLNGIAIKVNDQLLYSRDAIGFELKKDFLEWSDKNLAANPDYVALMRRQDCQQ